MAHATFLLPPFHGGGRREFVRRPKCYAFDTGFVTFVKGWSSIRDEDRGLLWEHLVLDMLRAHAPHRKLHYWQDRSKREVDFVVRGESERVHAIECKVDPDRFRAANLRAFRALYPQGENYAVSPVVKSPYKRRYGALVVTHCSTDCVANGLGDGTMA